jgi:Ca-activated chloride channel family protein
MEQIRTNGDNKELRDEIVDLGTRYGIVTPYTSYLAVESEAARPIVRFSAGDLRNKAPATAGPPPPKPDARAMTGMAGVTQSKRAREQQDVVRIDGTDEAPSVVKRAGGKTFYLRDGAWTDSELKPEAQLPETTITFGSDEYFALLKQKPALAKFFSLAERVVVVFEGRVYRVNAATP